MKQQAILFLMLVAGIAALGGQTPWQETSAANVTMEYRVTQDGLNLEVRLTGQTTGWTAAGFDPTTVMRNANIIIGYVAGGTPFLRDDWGTANTSHAADISLGGTSDLSLIEGSEAGGATILHFTIPLASGDQYDKTLQIGQSYPVLLARGSNGADNFTGAHAAAGFGTITLQPPVANGDELAGPGTSGILGAFPNPFNPEVTIVYQLKNSGPVSLRIYNQRGQLVHREGFYQSPGEYRHDWTAEGLPAGAYLVRLVTGEGSSSARLKLVK